MAGNDVAQSRADVPQLADVRQLNEGLIQQMKSNGTLRSPVLEQAYRKVLRHQFVPDHPLEEAYTDESVITWFNQDQGGIYSCSSRPSVMATMLEMLHIERGMRILEIGAGTGYNAALLAELTGSPARVWTIDLDAPICEEARLHLAAAGYEGVQVLCADGWRGYPTAAPYDRIIVTAAAYDIAPAWFDQLADGGIMVLPWAQEGNVVAFRRESGKLVKFDKSDAGFVAMRGEFGGEITLSREGGYYVWQSGWLTPEDLERLGRLTLMESWEKRCPLPAVEPLDRSEANFWDFCFFLAVEEPRLVVMKWIGNNGDVELRLGLVDLQNLDACFVLYPMDDPIQFVGYGHATLAGVLEGTVRRWFDLGRPSPERLQLTAYPCGEAPPPQEGETRIQRKWFEYSVAWS